MVLDPTGRFVEAQSGRAQEIASEQCVRGHAVGKRDRWRARVTHRASEQGDRHFAALAAHAPDDDVRGCVSSEDQQICQRVSRDPIVLIDELDVLGSRGLDADVARPARPA